MMAGVADIDTYDLIMSCHYVRTMASYSKHRAAFLYFRITYIMNLSLSIFS